MSATTIAVIKARFEEAADTLRALRLGPRDKPSTRHTHWPDVVHQAILAYGWSAARVRLPAPSPEAIYRLDETLAWLWPLAEDERRLVMGRAFRLPWGRLAGLEGRAARTLRYAHERILAGIAARVNAGGPTAPRRSE